MVGWEGGGGREAFCFGGDARVVDYPHPDESARNIRGRSSGNARMGKDAAFGMVPAVHAFQVHDTGEGIASRAVEEERVRDRRTQPPRDEDEREEEAAEALEPGHFVVSRRKAQAISSSTPNAHTITGPVGKSYWNDNARPPADASTPAPQDSSASPRWCVVNWNATAAGTTRKENTSSTPAIGTDSVITTPNDR